MALRATGREEGVRRRGEHANECAKNKYKSKEAGRTKGGPKVEGGSPEPEQEKSESGRGKKRERRVKPEKLLESFWVRKNRDEDREKLGGSQVGNPRTAQN